jgi:hypothetical protein
MPTTNHASEACEALGHLDVTQIGDLLLGLLSPDDCETLAERLKASPYVIPEQSPAERERYRLYVNALQHWQGVGYRYETARALAAVLHGKDPDVKVWARGIMQTKTNLRLEDMI